MNTTIVLGLAFGDEGKGKLVDALAAKAAVVARFGGGANAGHTIWHAGEKTVLHQLPSGALHPGCRCVIGAGCVVYLPGLLSEISELRKGGVNVLPRLTIDPRATLLLTAYKKADEKSEKKRGRQKIGTTKSGIGPAYAARASREACRVGDLLASDALTRVAAASRAAGYALTTTEKKAIQAAIRELRGTISDGAAVIRAAQKKGKGVLFEGAQGTALDISHGSYPFVTSSSTTIGGVYAGLGVAPTRNTKVLGVAKAYTSRVGAGPFPTELLDSNGEKLREIGQEYGATTGRPRRCGWIDIPALAAACRLNGVTEINLTKLDVLSSFQKINICTGYRLNGKRLTAPPFLASDLASCTPIYTTLPGWGNSLAGSRNSDALPLRAKKYIAALQARLPARISSVGVGPDRKDLVHIPRSWCTVQSS